VVYQFQKHYTREDVRGLLPQVRAWLEQSARLRNQLPQSDPRAGASGETVDDLGGERVNAWVRQTVELLRVWMEFEKRGVLLKDLDRGLVDFPAVLRKNLL